ncbi:MAG: hypothetical protein KAW45_06915, partial [Thermoplasmatales archaeon]|nr:hypothetical protein [Thermoplasmatales archaeon]
VGESVLYTTVSTDPENDLIQYGWVWNCDDWDWGTVDYWTGFYESGEVCEVSHIFEEPGVFPVRVKARDEYGAEKLWGTFSLELITIVCKDDEIVDQYQLRWSHTESSTVEQPKRAQSFKPNASTISKLKLKLSYQLNGDSYPMTLTIRDNLTGTNLTKVTKTIETEDLSNKQAREWVEICFSSPIDLVPQSTYYIVLESSYIGEGFFGWCQQDEDPYPRGKCWFKHYYEDEWGPYNNEDFCFVTYE